MIVSEARILANRANAQKSTGPKTAEGKERSRANALKHGLCSSVVVIEDAQMVQARAQSWYYALKPQNYFHGWVVDEVAVTTIRIDRCERMERRIRSRSALRAEVSWEEDRRLAAEVLGSMLASRPGEMVARLRGSAQGTEWLIARWAMLAHSAEAGTGWTPEQTALAFDLLGTPAALRVGPPGSEIDCQGRAVADIPVDPAAVARRQIEALQVHLGEVAGLDEVDRVLASADLDDAPALGRLRRYEATLHKRLRWCLAQLPHQDPHVRPHPDVRPRYVAEVEPEPEPEPAPQPEPVAAEPPPAPDAVVDEVEAAGAVPEPEEQVQEDAPSPRRQRRADRVRARREAEIRRRERIRA